MTLPLRDFLYMAVVLVTVTGSIAVLVSYIFSRVRRESERLRKESDDLRESYIKGLERDRTELKSDNADKDKLVVMLKTEISELRGQVVVLRDLVLSGHCRRFTLDTATGGCTHCGLGLPSSMRHQTEDSRG